MTPAVGLNRVSGRALQQAAAACSHCERDPGVAAPRGPDVRAPTGAPLPSSSRLSSKV